jgi:hypothetical protein
MSAANHGIFENLRGVVCACGEPKLAGKSFCRSNYFALPKDLRNELYRREGYPDTFRQCLKLLGLPEPKAGGVPVRRDPRTHRTPVRTASLGPPLEGRNQDFCPREYRKRTHDDDDTP